MIKERKKIDIESFLKGYSKQIDPLDTKEIYEKLELTKMHLKKIINLIDLEQMF